MFRQNERIRHSIKFLLSRTICESKDIVDSLVKNLWTHKPSSGRRVRSIGDVSAEEFFVIDIVAVSRLAPFFIELR